MAIFEAKVKLIHPNYVKIDHLCRVRANSMIEACQLITLTYCSRGVIEDMQVVNLHAKYRTEYFREAPRESRVKHLH